MTHDSQLLRLENANGGDLTDMLQPHTGGGGRGMAPHAPAAQNPVARVRSIMHGRWKYAIPLAIACAAAGAYLGFKSKVPKYRASAQILYNPVKNSPDGSSTMLGFQEYVQSQCTTIHSHREINLALQEPAWRTIAKGNSEQMIAEFGKKLVIEKSGGLVELEYIDEDADVALAAVKATVSAYKKLYQDSDPDHMSEVLKLLDNDRVGINNNITALNDQRKKICGDSIFTPETLEKYYNNKVDEFTKIETQMNGLKMDLLEKRGKLKASGVIVPDDLKTDEAPSPGPPLTETVATQGAVATTQPATQGGPRVAGGNGAPGAASPLLNPRPKAEDLALHDQYMEALVNQLRNAKANLANLQKRFPANNPQVKEAQLRVDGVQTAIDLYIDEVQAKGMVNGTPVASTDPRLIELENMVQTYRQLNAIMTTTKFQAADLGDKVTNLRKNQETQDDLKRRLDSINAKYERMNNDLQLANRANFLSEGDPDYGTYEDKRYSMAGAGGGVGGILGFGVIFLLGFLDQRVKTIADAKYTFRRSRRVLGILPTLPDNLGDPRQAAFAAHCVHHVRNLLQLSMSPDRGTVMAVTSASPGEGKTSLTLSLGLSFAAANSRTLLIDCDVVGGGLTARVNAIIRRKMGDVLKRQGRLTEQQLALALALANQKNIRLGEAIVQLGYLTATDIDEALTVQKESLVGLLDVLDGEPLNGCITNAGSPNLFILPRGMAVASNSGQVSAKAIRRIIAEARAQYDVVLIDTGPVLGSLEASIVASEADGVVLAVSRGQQKSLAERAMELLDSIGANTAGIVFNRAQTDDMDTIQYSSSIPASALQSVPQQTAGGSGTSRLGPIAFAVASATNQSTGNRATGVNGHGPAAGGAAGSGAAAGQKDQMAKDQGPV